MTAAPPVSTRHGTGDRDHRRKLVALAFLAVPLALVALFAVGEGVGDEAGWWGHLIQLGLVLLLAAGAWFLPRVIGPVLVLLGAAFVVWIGVNAADGGFVNLPGILLVGAPLVASGVLFARSGRP